MLTQFSHLTIKAKDVNATAQWYCDKLGFTKDQNADSVFASLSHPQLGGLGIYAIDTPTPIHNGAGAFYKCANIHKTVTALRAKGVVVEDPIQYKSEQNWFSFFYDFEGNKWGIIE